MPILLMVCIFAASVVSDMVGQGGGVLYTPVQVWFGTNIYQAATTSLFLIMALSVSSSLTYAKSGTIDWRLALVLESVTTTSAFIGGLFSDRFKADILLYILAAAIGAAALPLILNMQGRRGLSGCSGGRMSWHRNINGEQYCINLLIAVPFSAIAGLVSGMVGVGGGVLKVAGMVLLLGVPLKIAVGSSAFMVGITAAGGFTGHIIKGPGHWQLTLPLALVVFVGAQVGSRISIHLEKKMLEKILGWLLLVIAAATVIKISF